MNLTERARAREQARDAAAKARKAVKADPLHALFSGELPDPLHHSPQSRMVDAIKSLADAVDKLADVSEAQEGL